MKIYVALNVEQRLDVQIISNTNIEVSGDLFDRMQETFKGPKLRDWCQEVGLLQVETDFADRRRRGGPISVQIARTFISNYFSGFNVDAQKFDFTATNPIISPTGLIDLNWELLTSSNQAMWTDQNLKRAGKEFAKLVVAQRNAFSGKKAKPDMPEKALNIAILAAWAYTAGMLHANDVRLSRHYSLANTTGKDPLNAAELAKASHKTDPDNYRGLGYRTDAKERGRFVELFYLQAEKGEGINAAIIKLAIAKYHAKIAQLEVIEVAKQGE